MVISILNMAVISQTFLAQVARKGSLVLPDFKISTTAKLSQLNFIILLAHTLRYTTTFIYLFIYLGFYVAFNTVQVISRRVVGRAEKTSTYSSLGFCTVNCLPTASNYQLSHMRPCRESNPGLRWEARVTTTFNISS